MSNTDAYGNPIEPPLSTEKISFGYDGFQQSTEAVAAPPLPPQQPYNSPANPAGQQTVNPYSAPQQPYVQQPQYTPQQYVPYGQQYNNVKVLKHSKASLIYFFISLGLLIFGAGITRLPIILTNDSSIGGFISIILNFAWIAAILGLIIYGFIAISKAKKAGERLIFYVLGVVCNFIPIVITVVVFGLVLAIVAIFAAGT